MDTTEAYGIESEEHTQKKVAKHFLELEAALKSFTFFAVAGGSVRLPIHIAKRLKDMGVRAGVSDLVFLGKNQTAVFIELKAQEKGKERFLPLSENQERFFAIVEKLGFGIYKLDARNHIEAIDKITGILRAHGILGL